MKTLISEIVETKTYLPCVKLTDVHNFDIDKIFDCGQCFRWYEQADGSYTGVAYGKVLNVSTADDNLVINNINEDDFKNIFTNYFDLNRDYSSIKKLYEKDAFLKEAMDFGWGIHILNQDIFECLISFIISTQNQIPRIKKIVDGISKMYGDEIKYNGKVYYTFPSAEQLKYAKADDFSSFEKYLLLDRTDT